VPVALLALFGGGLISACGQARQDVSEPSGTFPVAVVRSSFAPRQTLASSQRLIVAVRNAGSATIPDLAITVEGLSAPVAQTGAASEQRPVWIIDDGPGPRSRLPVQGTGADQPGGYVTVLTNTWASGTLLPGRTATFAWTLTPVRAGRHAVRYTVAAGLNGRARARLASGVAPTGTFTVAVAGAPPHTHVDPLTGRVVAGPTPGG